MYAITGRRFFIVCVVVIVLGCSQSNDGQVTAVAATSASSEEVANEDATLEAQEEGGTVAVRKIEWDLLIPDEWRPDKLMAEYNAVNLDDDDPRSQELYEKLKRLWNESPVVLTLEGERLKLPGFVVPLEMDAEKIDEFLLVPYFGACIHAPPPPANQTVHVVTQPDTPFEGKLFDTVWVTGTMRVETLSSDLGEAGYRLEDARVLPYQDAPSGEYAP